MTPLLVCSAAVTSAERRNSRIWAGCNAGACAQASVAVPQAVRASKPAAPLISFHECAQVEPQRDHHHLLGPHDAAGHQLALCRFAHHNDPIRHMRQPSFNPGEETLCHPPEIAGQHMSMERVHHQQPRIRRILLEFPYLAMKSKR